ncbi:MAG: xanthine dehydrogenase family protein molybdopterin-binding subunit [Phaeodactylibacter sp.]|nr:xanthine dehydrogenase family protein molybdopterin-binding subunit [Phaeodactylibacter sp.]MCB9052840.1 xanthine dehydrogenase family protein molybdopterin-binding subunit [Lewinellaceae bacterium]
MNGQNESSRSTISRRQFLAAAGGVTFVIAAGAFAPDIFAEESRSVPGEDKQITAWVRVQEDGRIIIYNPAAEMGQGSMTALAVIIAEEMDADWADVQIEFSPIEPSTYGLQWGGKLGGPMITVGSRTVRGYYHALRHAGAQARYVLLHNAAEKWGVPMAELNTGQSVVIHKAGGRKMSYGEIAAFAKAPPQLPEIPEVEWRKPEDFRLIGKVIPRFDIPGKVDGSAMFSIDVQVPGMVYGAISRSPVNGSKPELLNEEDVRETEGLIDIVQLDHGIGVIAETYEQALNAKKKLQISWSKGAKAEGFDSVKAYALYHKTAQDKSVQGEVVERSGDVAQALRSAYKTYDIEYNTDFAYHAQMEPLNAVVSVAADGKSAEAWVGSQAPDTARRAISETLNIDFSQVTLHPCYLGGGFGRRSMADYVEEATLLSNKIRRPVKLIWTREDDVQYGAFRPICLQRMQAATDEKGNLTGWGHCITGTGGGLLDSGATINYYTIPNRLIEVRNIDHGVRTKHWRSVAHGPNKYAIEAFLDEIAVDQGIDPYELRRRLMKDHPRELKVLDEAAALATWGEIDKEGRARGIAFCERSGSFSAAVVEISLDRSSGQIRVHRVWAALDAGVVVQPDNAIAQMEGGIVMGISNVLQESITFRNGKVRQSNFHDYPILRMADAPESIEVRLIPSREAPQGIGEASLPLMGGAIANAFLKLTGKPLRHMPFTPERVLEALEG